MIGKRLANYQILEELGRGGMGIVYKAHQLNLNRLVAIKILHPSLGNDRAFRVRFLREAKAMARLNHPHIVHIFDTGEQDGFYFYAAEIVDGPTLSDRMAHHAPFSPQETLLLLYPICQALDHAHHMNLVHRDVKPSNVILKDGKIPKVTDFGIAKILDDVRLTVQNVVMGTPFYMSPEQAEGKDVTGRSDQYSLGCIAVEMLTGKPPFPEGTPATVIYKHISEDPEPPSLRVPSLGPQMDRAILKALSKDPGSRYETCIQFFNAMDGAKQIRIRPSVHSSRSFPWTATRMALAGILLAGGLFVAGSYWISNSSLDQTEPPPGTEEVAQYIHEPLKAHEYKRPPTHSAVVEPSPRISVPSADDIREGLEREAEALVAEEKYTDAATIYQKLEMDQDAELMQRMENLLNQGNAFLQEGDWSSAWKVFEACNGIHSSKRSRLGMAMVLEGKGAVLEAIELYNRLRQEGGPAASVALNRMDALKRVMGQELIMQCLQEAETLRIKRQFPDCMRLLKTARWLCTTRQEEKVVDSEIRRLETEWRQ